MKEIGILAQGCESQKFIQTYLVDWSTDENRHQNLKWEIKNKNEIYDSQIQQAQKEIRKRKNPAEIKRLEEDIERNNGIKIDLKNKWTDSSEEKKLEIKRAYSICNSLIEEVKEQIQELQNPRYLKKLEQSFY